MYQASLPLAFNHVCLMKFLSLFPHFKLDNVDVLAFVFGKEWLFYLSNAYTSVCITAFALHCRS